MIGVYVHLKIPTPTLFSQFDEGILQFDHGGQQRAKSLPLQIYEHFPETGVALRTNLCKNSDLLDN